MTRTLRELRAFERLKTVVNTHYHEDHTGNNSLFSTDSRISILAHPDAVREISHPPKLPWYRAFLFGPNDPTRVEDIGTRLETENVVLEVIETPGHCPGHICLFEPDRRLLFSGDLYIAADLDSQLGDAHGPDWISSLKRVIALQPEMMFDAHGTIFSTQDEVLSHLGRKLAFLENIRDRVHCFSDEPQSIEQLTRKVFDRRDLVDWLSLGDGWLSLITGSDFSRGNIVRSFLAGADVERVPD